MIRRTIQLLLIGALLICAGCGEDRIAVLPYPTPAQHDLVVLTRPGPLTYTADSSGGISGLEHDLVETFALELGVGVQYVVASPEEMNAQLESGSYHIAAAWLSPPDRQPMVATSPIFQTRDVLAQHEASLPLTDISQLSGKTVHAMAGSRQVSTLRHLAQEVPELTVVEVGTGDILDLLEALGSRKVDYVAMDKNLEDLANQFVPSLRTSLLLSEEQAIVWLLGSHPNPELQAKANAFVERIQHDGTLARLEDRYFGHVRRLTQADVTKFLGQIETALPKLRKHFQAAETVSGIDWRLIAAVAYHESHWDPNATSPTNVRGIMMLTEETADRLGVGNRLDPRESILAGARYLNILKDQQEADVREPDRTWLALAAYNIGPGHFNAARTLARQMKADPGAWYEMKRVLPLLAKPQYYEKLKSGRARGGEAVILVENIRSYYDILARNQSALKPVAENSEAATGIRRTEAPGLKLGLR